MASFLSQLFMWAAGAFTVACLLVPYKPEECGWPDDADTKGILNILERKTDVKEESKKKKKWPNNKLGVLSSNIPLKAPSEAMGTRN